MSRFERGQQAYTIRPTESGEAGVFGTRSAADLMQENISALTGGRARFNRKYSDIPGNTSGAENNGENGSAKNVDGESNTDESHIVHEGYVFVKVSPGEGTTQITIGDKVHHVLRIG